MKKPKEAIRIYTPEERRWNQIKQTSERFIEQYETELLLWKEVLELCNKRLKGQ
jgi:hypothetical protein